MALISLAFFGGNVLADGENVTAAPLNPEFLKYMSGLQMGMVTLPDIPRTAVPWD